MLDATPVTVQVSGGVTPDAGVTDASDAAATDATDGAMDGGRGTESGCHCRAAPGRRTSVTPGIVGLMLVLGAAFRKRNKRTRATR
jgi:MYXO-CTERM domain-containing protein